MRQPLVQRMGLLGGSFDPIHYGHLAIAEECRWALELNSVSIVPAAQQPLKPGGHNATPEQRFAMVQLACADNETLMPSDGELSRPLPSYTIDTVLDVRQRFPSLTELWLLLGADAAMSLPDWYEPQQLLSLVRLAVVSRPGVSFDLNALEAKLPGITERTRVIVGPQLAISSTDLRARFATGRPVRYQMPASVIAYCHDHGVYSVEPALHTSAPL